MSTFSHVPTRGAAILLLGPTGAGKTPLGQWLEERGLWGHRCFHFDFGANLREIVACHQPDEWIGADDIALLEHVLESGALLEDRHFPLAERILQRFLSRRATSPAWIVLNGLPRHAGQARAVGAILQVQFVVSLSCDAKTVFQRIQDNPGGDRSDRRDDCQEAVYRKLAVFEQRTAPLLDYYRTHGIPLFTIEVAPAMGPRDLYEALASVLPR